MTETVLSFKNVSKKFGTQLALDKVSFNVKKGSIYGLIGRNGSGKTTIMKIISDLSQATSGEVVLLGNSKGTSSYVQSLRRIGAVIEMPAAYNKLTAYQNMKVICLQRGIHDFSLIDEMLQFVNLADTGKKKFKQFSLGMKQRLGIAMALVAQPDFLILDEPINGLDPFAIIEFRELIQKINRERNTTILISSHILTELYQVSTCFGFIHNGKMVQEISKEDFCDLVVDAIELNVDNAELAAVALRENFNIDFQVISDHDIKISDTTLSVAEVNHVLAENGIAVNAIGKQENTLEDYYTNLVKGIEGK